ncbi:hypothetical protein SLS62_007732 [Diatrype stigma]|uniref:NAD-dependent epimerase/dehydratase domain-containing protein n=1 Tax=Diatrype stigma TaxID=117547 RepID=A0AAN9UL00_9PEZI
MKLIVAGATGYVAKEVVRQSLGRKEISSVIALARKPVPVPEGLANSADAAKLHNVCIEDYGQYPDHVKKEFAGAGACIWTVGISPGTATTMDRDELKRVCDTCTIAGMKAMYEAGPAKPFRFLYVCGETADRDQTKKLSMTAKKDENVTRAEYDLMRGECENHVLQFASEHEGIEAAAARPAMIYAPDEPLKTYVLAPIARLMIGAPGISTVGLAKVLLDQVIGGFEKDPLHAKDLVRLSKVTA